MACLGDEAPLALERLFEAREHVVQRVRETLELVPRVRNRKPLAEPLGRNLRRSPRHLVHGAKASPCEQIAGEALVQERARAGEDEQHGDRERGGDAQPDWKRPHGPSSSRRRYPTPRTVSSDL